MDSDFLSKAISKRGNNDQNAKSSILNIPYGYKTLITAWDMLLIGIAFGTMFLGLAKRWSLWLRKLTQSNAQRRSGNWAGLVKYLLGHARILKRTPSGIFHLLVFWGFVIPLMTIILTQFGFTLPRKVAWSLSLLQDVSGIALLTGTLFFLAKRICSHMILGTHG